MWADIKRGKTRLNVKTANGVNLPFSVNGFQLHTITAMNSLNTLMGLVISNWSLSENVSSKFSPSQLVFDFLYDDKLIPLLTEIFNFVNKLFLCHPISSILPSLSFEGQDFMYCWKDPQLILFWHLIPKNSNCWSVQCTFSFLFCTLPHPMKPCPENKLAINIQTLWNQFHFLVLRNLWKFKCCLVTCLFFSPD